MKDTAPPGGVTKSGDVVDLALRRRAIAALADVALGDDADDVTRRVVGFCRRRVVEVLNDLHTGDVDRAVDELRRVVGLLAEVEELWR